MIYLLIEISIVLITEIFFIHIFGKKIVYFLVFENNRPRQEIGSGHFDQS